MSALLNSLRKRIPYNDLLYFLLIYLSVNSILLGVELVVRGTSAAVLRVIILFGILFGWLLGRSRIRFGPALALAVISGFILTVLRVSGIGAAAWNLLGGALGFLWRWVFQRI
ncbi:MAG: hypothetical protein P8Y34_06235, partial [Anaerolineales bacterium]